MHVSTVIWTLLVTAVVTENVETSSDVGRHVLIRNRRWLNWSHHWNKPCSWSPDALLMKMFCPVGMRYYEKRKLCLPEMICPKNLEPNYELEKCVIFTKTTTTTQLPSTTHLRIIPTPEFELPRNLTKN